MKRIKLVVVLNLFFFLLIGCNKTKPIEGNYGEEIKINNIDNVNFSIKMISIKYSGFFTRGCEVSLSIKNNNTIPLVINSDKFKLITNDGAKSFISKVNTLKTNILNNNVSQVIESPYSIGIKPNSEVTIIINFDDTREASVYFETDEQYGFKDKKYIFKINAQSDLYYLEDNIKEKSQNFSGKMYPNEIKTDLIDNTIHRKEEDKKVTSEIEGKYPEASERLLDEADVKRLSLDELKIMRNEIYARHGYIFKSNEMRDYFFKQAWYRPTVDNVDNLLTDIEKKNISLIKLFEAEGN